MSSFFLHVERGWPHPWVRVPHVLVQVVQAIQEIPHIVSAETESDDTRPPQAMVVHLQNPQDTIITVV